MRGAATGDGRIRVVHLVSRLNVGGIAPHVFAVCGGLPRDEFSPTVLTGRVDRHEEDMRDYRSTADIPIVTISELGRAVSPLDDLRALRRVYRTLRELRPDIVHTHMAKAGLIGRVAAWAARVPVRMHSFHGHVFRGYFPAPIGELVQATERALGRLSAVVVAPSPARLDELVDEYRIVPRSKGRVVPDGIDVDEIRTLPEPGSARRALNLPPDAFVIGMVGRIVPIKNHRLMLDALTLLADGEKPHLVVVGEGSGRESLERRSHELGLAGRVTFTGFQADLRVVYGAIDLLALSSLNEGVPTAILEAMASGVPVVAAAVGGVVDVVHDRRTGLLVPPQDAAALARAVREMMLSAELRDACAANAAELVAREYDVSATVGRATELYRELARREGRPPGRRP